MSRRLLRTHSIVALVLLGLAGCGGEGETPAEAVEPMDASVTDGPRQLDAFEATDATCIPIDEICNGLDDDCDGLVDDQDPDIERATFDDVQNCGSCRTVCQADRATRMACRSSDCAIVACEAGFADYNGDLGDGCESDCLVSEGGREICDTSDNDCDGESDEDFDFEGDPENCGGCGVVCEPREQASIRCLERACALDACAAGFVDADGESGNGCEYRCTVRSTDQIREFCNGLDDDCDGAVDEPEDVPPPDEDFCGQNGVCGYECSVDDDCHDPTRRCNDGHICVPLGGVPDDLPCEADADCQALDRGFSCQNHTVLGEAGPVTTRRCVERVHEPICDGQAGYRCVRPPAFLVGTEVGLCDGLDNNCNGQVDEDFVNALFVDGVRRTEPRTCSAGEGACSQPGRIVCTADLLGTECSAVALPAARDRDDDCNGLDDDCDGRLDEDYQDTFVELETVRVYAFEASRPGATAQLAGLDLVPDDGRTAFVEARACARRGVLPWANLTWAEASAACAGAGARLCSRDEWMLACAGPGEAYPYGAAYDAQTCNGGGHDADPAMAGDQDGVLPTASLAACERGGVFDLSGNLKEWTDDLQDGLRPIRGGGTESNIPAALACEATGDLKPEEFRSATLGFRCCQDL